MQTESEPTTEPTTGPTTGLSPRMRQLMEAALDVVAHEGIRGLTHRAVDRQAGLPEGSTSAYLRTRHALQSALVDYLATHLSDEVEALARRISEHPDDDARAAAEVGALLEQWLSGNELVARFALGLEATRDAELLQQWMRWRERMLEVVSSVVEQHGTPEPRDRAETVVAGFEGLLFGALLREPADRTPYLRRCTPLLIELLSPAT